MDRAVHVSRCEVILRRVSVSSSNREIGANRLYMLDYYLNPRKTVIYRTGDAISRRAMGVCRYV